MESLDKLQHQLHSLDELRSIVKTMKALSAASIRQYDQAVDALDSYYQTIERGLYVVLKDTNLDQTGNLNGSHRSQNPPVAAVIFGSDHGLCGRFNDEIADYAIGVLDRQQTLPDKRLLLAAGSRAASTLKRKNNQLDGTVWLPGSTSRITSTVREILLFIDKWRTADPLIKVFLFYNRHAKGGGYQPTGFALLPVDLRRFQQLEEQRWPSRNLPTFSMDREQLLSRLVHQYLSVSIFRACAESQASEHTSRLSAMQAAERNLDDRLQKVTQNFRTARQSEITAEMMEIVSGFEAITTADSGNPDDKPN